MEGFSSSALLVRQRTHLSASSSSRESGFRNTFGSKPQRRSARICCQKQEQQADNGNQRIKQKFEKYPDGPTQMDHPIEAHRQNIVPRERVYDSLSLDSEDDIRGYAWPQADEQCLLYKQCHRYTWCYFAQHTILYLCQCRAQLLHMFVT